MEEAILCVAVLGISFAARAALPYAVVSPPLDVHKEAGHVTSRKIVCTVVLRFLSLTIFIGLE
jgi:hypothetical protein